MSEQSDEKMVVLARFVDVRQAEFALSVLVGHEIDGFIDVPFTSSMFPHYMLGSGGVALLVRESDVERANALLYEEGESVD